MFVYAVLKDGLEVAAFRSFRADIAREDCEIEAIELGLAARLPGGVALLPDVEIVCLQAEE